MSDPNDESVPAVILGDLGKTYQATFTLVCFYFKTLNFCYGYACRSHYSCVFEKTFENAADPVLVENSGIAFLCKWTKTEIF